MNKRQKEVLQHALISEKHMIRRLKFVYQKSLDDINKEIAKLMSRDQTQSVIYQKQYQEALKSQIEAILTQMENSNFETISEYLETCYEDGFVGAMYDLHGQGIPLIMPINQQLMVEAVATNSKLSTTLYKRLCKDIPLLKKKITVQIGRGISSNLSYHEIAMNLDSTSKIGYGNAMRIAQTEGHRVQTSAQLDACHAAKEKGADIVKQWDSTLDSRTRESHRKADGQIRELDEDFEVGGYHGSAPGHIGVAKEDIKCRCSLLQRARSALDEDELKTLQERAKYFGLDNAENFEDFKKKYLKAVENSAESGIIKTSEKFEIPPDKINKFFLKPGAKHAQEFFDVGYSVDDYERLFDDIESEFDENKMVDVKNKSNGALDFSIFMYLGVENKKRFRTVWRKDTPESKPRIITGHRED